MYYNKTNNPRGKFPCLYEQVPAISHSFDVIWHAKPQEKYDCDGKEFF